MASSSDSVTAPGTDTIISDADCKETRADDSNISIQSGQSKDMLSNEIYQTENKSLSPNESVHNDDKISGELHKSIVIDQSAKELDTNDTDSDAKSADSDRSHQNEDKLSSEPRHDEDEVDNNYEGRRMQLLRQSISMILKRKISSVKFSLFRQNFLPLYKHSPDVVKAVHRNFTQQLEDNISKEVTQIYQDENVPGLMNKLDRLIQNASTGKNADFWRPSGKPDVDVLAHVMPIKQKEEISLEKVLQELEFQNALLQEAVRVKQRRLLDTKHAVEKHENMWKEAAALTSTMPTKDMEEFIQKY